LLAACVGALGIGLGLTAILAGQTGGNASKGDTEWRFFGSDSGSTRYSLANQTNAGNVGNLSVA